MSDQQAPEEGAEQTAADTPQEGTEQQQTSQEEVDWQKRYLDLQPEYTRATQELSTHRQQMTDPEYRAQMFRELAAELGYDVDEGDDPDDGDTQTDPYDQRISRVEEALTQRAAQEQEQERLDWLETQVEQGLAQLPQGLTEKQKDWIVSRAIAMDAVQDQHGNAIPNITGAHEEFEALRREDQQSWAKTKRAPHISANGRAGTQAKNTVDMTRQERQDWMAEQLAANEQ